MFKKEAERSYARTNLDESGLWPWVRSTGHSEIRQTLYTYPVPLLIRPKIDIPANLSGIA